MQIFLIIALAIAVLAIIFAVQNLVTVTVTLFFWSFEGSLALVMVISLVVGALISLLVSAPGILRRQITNANQKKKLTQLETERDQLNLRVTTAESDVRTLEEQVAGLSAEVESGMTGLLSKPASDVSGSSTTDLAQRPAGDLTPPDPNPR